MCCGNRSYISIQALRCSTVAFKEGKQIKYVKFNVMANEILLEKLENKSVEKEESELQKLNSKLAACREAQRTVEVTSEAPMSF